MTKASKRPPRTADEGWINVQLSESPRAKLREMMEKSRPKVSLKAVIDSAVEREWETWDARRRAEVAS